MMDVEVVDRIELIPPKGLLEDSKDIIEEKLNGGELRYVKRPFLPQTRDFEVELVVDDDCGVCPTAIEITAELVAVHKNIRAKVYNITYTEPPFKPIKATPAFRINKKVVFYGVPFDPKYIRKYFMTFFKQAYIVSHPKLEEVLNTLKEFSEKHGYMRNPNDRAVMEIIYGLLQNIDKYGYPYCPCRPLNVEGATSNEEIYKMNKDKVCPCSYVHKDIKERGHCLCGLFWSEEKVEELIKGRIREHGWLIEEIEKVQEALEVLKKRIATGNGKQLAESILNKMKEIYDNIPD